MRRQQGRDKLTKEFETRKSGLDYERYWGEIIVSVR
jgi:hypothetical protein